MKKLIIEFLKRNGFERIEKDSYALGCFNLVFENSTMNDCEFIQIANGYGTLIAAAPLNSDSHYWVVGVLVYHGIIKGEIKK